MKKISLVRRLTAEALGTALLLATVVGSGIMGDRLAGGNAAIALLGNTLSTATVLIVLISIFGPISGAHFNPVVTGHFFLRKEIEAKTAVLYILTQFLAAVAGVYMAHVMFAVPLIEVSDKLRAGPPQWFAEFVATFGLIATIAGSRHAPDRAPLLVGLYIAAAYWFTASTSFANPAVTVARALTHSFAGIAPSSVPGFVMAQIAGASSASAIAPWLFKLGPVSG